MEKTADIWKKNTDLCRLNALSDNTIIALLGIEYTAIGDNFLQASMPVDSRTHQPHGLLHGGASVVLAETIGSVAANLVVGDDKVCVGLEVNANHIRSVKKGVVTGTATAVHIGYSTQVWQIEICNERQQLVCTSRLTVAVIDKPKQ
ncbi:hotdog fold thioesterase [Psychromonas sp. 14N.309.X.WAT.B.A12]|jgi:1,4-dihydroxy-2-naphthoyl-CoA hydrolase|uniref:hotdog fold thioesterase n=1 Tax=unclassified Psychromonas TaxID=2614957 RepID=UPI0025AF99DB|nr:hotdog fold thioesterase [Psychromonas sp. 14N.309.X.WAT.B.A12]MDN2662581.1 hotdog fold thioesterase [Psychromonas sp. 14N.309.X.WAT.B.A12]